MAQPTAPQCHAITTYYVNQYEEVVGRKPVVNRNKAKAGVFGLLMDYSSSEAKALIDYYLEHWEKPDLQWFLYNYEQVDTAKQDHDENEKIAARRRVATQARLEEWRNRWQNQKES